MRDRKNDYRRTDKTRSSAARATTLERKAIRAIKYANPSPAR
jgi:hypothetical protein